MYPQSLVYSNQSILGKNGIFRPFYEGDYHDYLLVFLQIVPKISLIKTENTEKIVNRE